MISMIFEFYGWKGSIELFSSPPSTGPNTLKGTALNINVRSENTSLWEQI